MQVAHDCARNDDACRPGKTLYEAKRDEHIHRWRDHAQERGECVSSEPDEQRPATPQLVAEGSGDYLPQSKAEQASTQSELGLRSAGGEVASKRWQGRKVHVDGQGPERG